MSFGSLANMNECATSMTIGKEQIQNIYGKRKKEEKKTYFAKTICRVGAKSLNEQFLHLEPLWVTKTFLHGWFAALNLRRKT